jgi:hypothetical protein
MQSLALHGMVLQASIMVRFAVQAVPDGEGIVAFRCLVKYPPPQDTEQSSSITQGVNEQSIGISIPRQSDSSTSETVAHVSISARGMCPQEIPLPLAGVTIALLRVWIPAHVLLQTDHSDQAPTTQFVSATQRG